MSKLGSVRVWLAAVLLAGIAAALIDTVIPGAGVIVVWPLFVIALAAIVLAPGVAVCPHCRRRVRLGASVCSHCGRDVM